MARPGDRNKLSTGRLKVRVKTGKGRTVSQKLWLERQLNDPYVHEAKKLGYRSRAAFKLSEIDDKYKFLKPGANVVDLGSAPGGWSQISAMRVKSVEGKGKVVAIDMHSMDEVPGVIFFKKDFYDEDAPDVLVNALGGEKADVVLSDMASHATGHRQTDHINIVALVETGYHFAQQILKARRNLSGQSAARRHREPAAGDDEEGFQSGAPREAHGQPR